MKKQNHTNSKGVTLVALIITIVVLIIIASIATYSGIDIIRSSRLTSFTTEMKIMQTEVNELYEQWKNGEIIIDDNGNVTIQEDESTQVSIGKDLTYDSDVENQASYVLIHELDLGDTLSDLKGYRYFDYATIEYLGIEGTEGEFFVNIEDRKVVSFKGFRYDGVMYYTLEQLPQSLYNVDYNPNQGKPTFDLSYEAIGDSKWRITVSNIQYDGNIDKWYVKYQEDGTDYWNTSEDLSFVVDKSWIYNVTIENGSVVSEPNKIFVNNVNDPELSEGMIPIKWVESEQNTGNWVICSANDPEWYNYIDQTNGVDGTSKWANVMLSDGKYYAQNSGNVDKTNKEPATMGQVVEEADLGSMFVWIPRYAYSIESGYHTNQAGKINISFLNGTEEYKTGDYICYSSQGEMARVQLINESGQGNWNEHPAFTYGDDTIPGVWVAKFEASSSNSSATNGGGNVKDLNVKVLPGKPSWRTITIGNSYTNCINMNNETNCVYYGISTNDNKIDPHLMKNSEWGAVAYLTQSSYGRNENEVTINNSSSYITGSAGNSVDADPDSGTTNDYTDSQGVLASTTGNETGIYDMNGGSEELIASYMNNGSSYLTTNGQTLLDAPDKHKDVYEALAQDGSVATNGNDNSGKNFEKMSSIFGNAIYEITANNYIAWYNDVCYMPYSTNPFFVRGGYSRIGLESGLFRYNMTNGTLYPRNSFRPIIVVY